MKNIILIVLLLWSGVGVWAQDKLTRRETERIRCAESRFLYTGIGPFPC